MQVDLHIHTNLSDGLYPPETVVKLATQRGLEIISLTDHDSFIGNNYLRKLAELYEIKIIRGIELSTVYHDEEFHILGYFKDEFTTELENFVLSAQADRQRRIAKGINNLKDKGIELSYEEVNRLSVGESIGRNHLAQVLVQRGYVDSPAEAFQKYLKYDHNIVPPPNMTLSKALKTIRENNGLAIWAHPPFRLFDKYLIHLMDLGLHGVEVYNRKKSTNHAFYYHTVAEKFGLLITVGSDWHGINNETFLLPEHYPTKVIDRFLDYFPLDRL